MIHKPSKLIFISPILHLIAHLSMIYAIFSFQSNFDRVPIRQTLFNFAKGSPIHPIAFNSFMLCITVVSFFLIYQLWAKPITQTQTLLIISIPLLVAFLLHTTLFTTPLLGGAIYAPYSPGDIETIVLSNLMVMFITIAIGLFYRNKSFLIVFFLIQFSILILRGWVGTIRYSNPPDALTYFFSLFGFGYPPLLLFLTFGYLLTISWVRKNNHDKKPSQIGYIMIGLVQGLLGGYLSTNVWISLPQNGWELGWVPTIVPNNAWNWSYTFATNLIGFAMFLPIVIAVAVAAYNSFPERIA